MTLFPDGPGRFPASLCLMEGPIFSPVGSLMFALLFSVAFSLCEWLVWVVRPCGLVGPLVMKIAVSPHNTSPVGILFVGLCVIPYFFFSIAEVGLVL